MAKNIFNTVQGNNPSSNAFDLSHDLKFSLNMGKLIPTLVMDVVPGDKINISSESMLRFAALIAPIMHRVKVTHHYFFVPNRILWSGWEDWITGNEEMPPPYIHPYNTDNEVAVEVGSIADYMGIPTFSLHNEDVAFSVKYNALPFAAMAKIYYEFYMDQNNVTETQRDKWEAMTILTEGNNSGIPEFTDTMMSRNGGFYRAWEHDYFTSALPFAQKGEDVMLPLGDFNDVEVFYQNPGVPFTGAGRFRQTNGGNYDPGSNVNLLVQGAGASQGNLGNSGGTSLAYDPNNTLLAETSALEAGAASVNNLRRAFRLQEWLEKNARGGTRYVESMLVHFGVRSSDARLQRPEYLGGSVQNMVISEVLSTAQTLDPTSGDPVNPVGQMAGHGISVGGSRRINYYAEEHGWIIGLISIMPQTAYQQGLAKKWIRWDRYEYFWPSFAHIGEQAIENQEVYLDPEQSETENRETFGYIPRYAEYRFENSRVAGQFKTDLDFWHLGRIFDERPLLNESFIYPQTSQFDRIFAVDSSVADTIYAHILNKVKARRKMPKYGTPFM